MGVEHAHISNTYHVVMLGEQQEKVEKVVKVVRAIRAAGRDESKMTRRELHRACNFPTWELDNLLKLLVEDGTVVSSKSKPAQCLKM